MRGAIPPVLKYLFIAWYLVKHRDNYTFTFTALGSGKIFHYIELCSEPASDWSLAYNGFFTWILTFRRLATV